MENTDKSVPMGSLYKYKNRYLLGDSRTSQYCWFYPIWTYTAQGRHSFWARTARLHKKGQKKLALWMY